LLPAATSASSASGSGIRETLLATLLYGVLTIAFTWPLCLGLTRDVPGDLGDPLLNAWILAWDGSHLGRGVWNANIFHPHPLSLAYSEHLLPQALTILPVQLAARNLILSYNLVFLSTFVLSGMGMFLLVRDITGSRTAAFVAGIAYAFAPYRVTSIPHLQVLSSQWMPFTLYGFRRYFDCTTRGHAALAEPAETVSSLRGLRVPRCLVPLVGAAAAWLLQNLSCGYYLLFFSPIVVGYIAWETATRSLWTNRRVVAALAAACAVVFVVTGLVMLPYFELRRLGFSPRSLEETTRFSADVYAYLTADPNLRLWGTLVQAWPWPEGALFQGFAIVVLAAAGVAQPFRAAIAGLPPSRRVTLIGFLLSLALLIVLLLGYTIRFPLLKITSFPRALFVVAALWSTVMIISATTRRAVREWLATPAGFFTLAAVFAIVMSWGPSIHARGRPIAAANLYTLFYNSVPGFDGVRAPARFGMVVAFSLAVLGGLGVAVLERRRNALLTAAVATALVFLEGIAVPIPINQNAIDYQRPGLAPLPGTVSEVPPVYRFVSTLPESSAIVELPLGEPAFDVRYMLYSTAHWRPLVNGYSGGAPADYQRLDHSLQDVLTRPDAAWEALVASRASHAIVHEAFYTDGRGRRVSEWLLSRGAQELAAFGPDRIFRIR